VSPRSYRVSAGDSIEDVLDAYPSLTRDDVLACLRFSAGMMNHHFRVQEVA
jgi:uncharacterized protein (DUF433 family)